MNITIAYAILQKRAVLTQNRKDFIRLYQMVPTHTGIIVYREDHQHVRFLVCNQEYKAELCNKARIEKEFWGDNFSLDLTTFRKLSNLEPPQI